MKRQLGWQVAFFHSPLQRLLSGHFNVNKHKASIPGLGTLQSVYQDMPGNDRNDVSSISCVTNYQPEG